MRFKVSPDDWPDGDERLIEVATEWKTEQAKLKELVLPDGNRVIIPDHHIGGMLFAHRHTPGETRNFRLEGDTVFIERRQVSYEIEIATLEELIALPSELMARLTITICRDFDDYPNGRVCALTMEEDV